jgi:hypothetical protein
MLSQLLGNTYVTEGAELCLGMINHHGAVIIGSFEFL